MSEYLRIEELAYSTHFLNTVLESLHSSVFLLSRERKVQALNESGKVLLKKDKKAILNIVFGNALECMNTEGGSIICGNSSQCQYCPLLQTINELFEKGEGAVKRNVFDIKSVSTKNEPVKKFFMYSAKTIQHEDTNMVLLIVDDITESEEQKETLRHREQQFKGIFENSVIGIYQIAPDGRLLTANPALLQMLGYSSFEEIERYDVRRDELEHQYSRTDFNKQIEAEGQITGMETTWKRKDGTLFYVRENVKSIRDETGNTIYYQGTVEDITEHKQMKEELAEREKKFREIFNNINDAIFLHKITDEGQPGKIIEVNDVACQMLGYSREEFMNMYPGDITQTNSDFRVQDVLKELQDKGYSSFEIHHITKNGSVIPVEINSHMINLNGEQLILSAVRDITERKKSEEALRKSEEHFRGIFQNTTIGIYQTTPDGVIIIANPALINMLGYSSFQELTKRNLNEEEIEPDYTREEFMQKVEKESKIIGLESIWKKRDGSKINVRENVTAIKDRQGNTIYYEGTVEDITERKKAERELKEKNKEIISSIRYAHRIQNALLPDKYELLYTLRDYFLIYRPRDIIGGDFYWTTKKDDKTIVAVGDCTGHGIPGALLTMLGITSLNEIVNQKGVIMPDQILGKLRRQMTDELYNYENLNNQDGIDITVCTIDPVNNTFYFAGAFNDLFFIHNDELRVIKGDAMPVGRFITMDSFTLKEFDYDPGDMIYMASDGYKDQFGGEKDKKFGKKRFKSLLKRIYGRTMTTQEEVLTNQLDKWMGDHWQLDDIIVLGNRLT